MNGGSTLYFRDRMPNIQRSLASKGFIFDLNRTEFPEKQHILDSHLHQILLDTMNICSLFNNLQKHTIDLETFQEIKISLCYRLLRFRSLHEIRLRSDIQTAYHLGLIILMMTTFLQHDSRRIMTFNLIPLCLEEVLASGLDEHRDEFMLWFMMIGGIWMSADVDGNLLASETRVTAQRLGITTWKEARNIVSKFPWVYSLHDEPGCSFWNCLYDDR